MKRVSRLAAVIISSILLFSFTTAAVAGDENSLIEDVSDYVTQMIK
ncbi:MAG: hypothetical protein IJ491_02755 [Clostridia bacterium]|nr:hypothetical protein [Clostridia bacterium]